MAAPNLSIALEPVVNGKVVYLPLAPEVAGATALFKLVMRLRITNNEPTNVTVTMIRYAFPNTLLPGVIMTRPDIVLADGGTILAKSAKWWSNGVVTLEDKTVVDNAVYMQLPAPASVKVEVSCSGFDTAAEVTSTLAPHVPGQPGGGYPLPFNASDLKSDERVITSARHWANGGSTGGQIYAHDVDIQRWDADSGSWMDTLPGMDGTKNEHYVSWGKPVRAMADGTVEEWLDDMEANTKLRALPVPSPVPVSGNHLWLIHGDERMLYPHLQKGSIPDELKVKGAPVNARQFIGRLGNSGNASQPHIHLQCHGNGASLPLRPIVLRTARLADATKVTAPDGASAPWVGVSKQGVPKPTVAIWPASTLPGYPVPAAGIARGGDWANTFWISLDRASFEARAQKLFDDSGRRLVYVTTFLEGGNRRWVGIARSGDWANSFWISPDRASFEARAQKLFDENKRRLTHVHTFPEGNQRRWVGIARSGDWANSFWISPDRASFEARAQKLFDENKRRLTHVHTFPEGNQRRWVGIARSGDWANSFWISPDRASFEARAQKLFDENKRRLTHVHTFPEGNQRRWVGIARSGDWANSFWVSGDIDTFSDTAQDLFDDSNRRLTCVEILTD